MPRYVSRGCGHMAFVATLALLLAGCGSAWKNPAGDARPTPLPLSGPPVEFRFLGLTDDRAYIHYTITVNTSRPIEEVDIAVWEDDIPASVGTYVWRNAFGSVQQPIQPGETYDVQDMIYPNARMTDALLQQVVFKDGGRWRPAP